MEQRRKKQKLKTMYLSLHSYIRNEKGYTYIELVIVLSLILILFPAVFFLSHTLEAEFKKINAREQLQLEYMAFHGYVTREMHQAINFYSVNKNLLFELPTGETIRYEHKKRKIIRSVKKYGENQFRGVTIILQHVYFSSFVPSEVGVFVDIGMQNWYSSLDLHTFVGKRVG